MGYKEKWIAEGYTKGYLQCLDDLLQCDYILEEHYKSHIKTFNLFNENKILID